MLCLVDNFGSTTQLNIAGRSGGPMSDSKAASVAPLLLLMVLSALIFPSFAAIAGQHGIAVLDYEPPMPGRDELGTEDQLHISADGSLTFMQKPYGHIGEAMEAVTSNGLSEIDIVVAGDARFGDVVQILTPMEVGSYTLMELHRFRNLGESQEGGSRKLQSPAFEGEVGRYELPIVVSYNAIEEACRFSLLSVNYDSLELYDRSFHMLDTWVQRAGGVEAFFRKTNNAEGVAARIQSPSNTPWRCIAAAIYATQAAGYPFMNLEAIQQQ